MVVLKVVLKADPMVAQTVEQMAVQKVDLKADQ